MAPWPPPERDTSTTGWVHPCEQQTVVVYHITSFANCNDCYCNLNEKEDERKRIAAEARREYRVPSPQWWHDRVRKHVGHSWTPAQKNFRGFVSHSRLTRRPKLDKFIRDCRNATKPQPQRAFRSY
jgi:hypothetical protein